MALSDLLGAEPSTLRCLVLQVYGPDAVAGLPLDPGMQAALAKYGLHGFMLLSTTLYFDGLDSLPDAHPVAEG